MHTAIRVQNFLRLSVPDGGHGGRDDIQEALETFQHEISCVHATNKGMTIVFREHSALFMHLMASGDMMLTTVDPNTVIEMVQGKLLPVASDGTVDETEALAMLARNPDNDDVRDMLALKLHEALQEYYHVTG